MPSSSPIPLFYRVFFLFIDPLIAGSGVYLYLFSPALAIDSFVPASISPYQPLQSFLLHQLSGALLLCIILDLFLLRKTNEIWIWKTQQAGQLVYDLVMIWSQWFSLEQQGRLSLGALRVEDWSNLLIIVVCAIARASFCAGVGLRTNGKKRR